MRDRFSVPLSRILFKTKRNFDITRLKTLISLDISSNQIAIEDGGYHG